MNFDIALVWQQKSSSVSQCSGYHVRFTRERSPVRARARLLFQCSSTHYYPNWHTPIHRVWPLFPRLGVQINFDIHVGCIVKGPLVLVEQSNLKRSTTEDNSVQKVAHSKVGNQKSYVGNYFHRTKYFLQLTCNQDGRVVKALDLSSNGRMSAWVRTPLLVIVFLFLFRTITFASAVITFTG